MMEKELKLSLSLPLPQVSALGMTCFIAVLHIIQIIPTNQISQQHLRLVMWVTLIFFSFQQLRKVQVNQGEVEYYRNQDITAILPCPWVEHWKDHNILITLSVFRENQGSSFWEPFAFNSKSDCTLLLVPTLIVICSNFHLLSTYQRREDFPLIWLNGTAVCHTCIFCGGDFVLYFFSLLP